jgi:integrase
MASIERRPRSNGTTGYRVVWRDPDTKAKDWLTFDDERDAERAKKLLNANGQRLAAANEVMAAIKNKVPSVADIVEGHIASLSGVEDRTRKDYRRMAQHHITPHLGSLPITTLDRERVRYWVNDLDKGVGTEYASLTKAQLAGIVAMIGDGEKSRAIEQQYRVSRRTVTQIRQGKTGGVSSKTLHNVHAILSAAMAYAIEKKLRDDNPCKGVRLPRMQSEEMVFLTPGEYSLLRSKIRAHYRTFVDVIAGTGMRWGEAVALTVGDVDLLAKTPTLRISKALKRAENGHYVGGPKTIRSVRTVSLPATLVEALIPLVTMRGRDEVLFTGPRGGRIYYGKFRSDVWAPSVAKAQAAVDGDGLEVAPELRLTVRPGVHALRHSHASWLIAAGVDLPTVQRRLGHESITTTIDRYGHLMPDQLEKAAAAADLAFLSPHGVQ